MSDFVNFNKRSITLPPGCKDLIDLLRVNPRSSGSTESLAGDKPGVTRGITETGSITQIGGYVAKMFQAHGRQHVVMIFLEREDLTFFLCRIPEPAGLNGSIWFRDDPGQVRIMKAFFQRWGLEAPEDAPLPFRIPGSNVQRTWQISPLPPSEAELSDLAKSLFQQFAHPLENLQLRFDFYETAV